jgi:hypothetical protein
VTLSRYVTPGERVFYKDAEFELSWRPPGESVGKGADMYALALSSARI